MLWSCFNLLFLISVWSSGSVGELGTFSVRQKSLRSNCFDIVRTWIKRSLALRSNTGDFCCAHHCSSIRKWNPELHFYRICFEKRQIDLLFGLLDFLNICYSNLSPISLTVDLIAIKTMVELPFQGSKHYGICESIDSFIWVKLVTIDLVKLQMLLLTL